jgi:hypothetical protein
MNNVSLQLNRSAADLMDVQETAIKQARYSAASRD